MKKKKIISLVTVLAFAAALGIGTKISAEGQSEYMNGEYSEILAESSPDDTGYEETYAADGNIEKVVADFNADEISEIGKNIAITTEEIEKYKKYFTLAGSDDPEKEAIDYAEERNALYVAAMENGYTVTDEEVWEYLEELKSILKQEENAGMYEAAVSGFESEEAYWDFEFEVYKVELPIQKYVASLESQYQKETGIENQEKFDAEWNEKFEEIKEEFVEEQNFTSVNEKK